MKEVDLYSIYQLGATVHLLTQYQAKNRGEIYLETTRLQDSIKDLFHEFPSLTVCRVNGKLLINQAKRVDKWFDKIVDSKGVRLNVADDDVDIMFETLIDYAKQFETVLLADLANLDVYHPQQKRAYNTETLIDGAEVAFGSKALKKLNAETKREINEAGRCLLFDNYTATGFHILRALEVVIHSYYMRMCKPTSDKKLNGWADYISALYKHCGEECKALDLEDKKHVKTTCTLLQLIKDSERNLIMHPEITLNEDDAIDLFDKCKNAVVTMAEKL